MRTLVILPSYNESKTLPKLIPAILEHDFVDVVVVDDASPDGTANIVKELQRTHGKRVHLIERPPKSGRGTAVIDGLKYAQEHEYNYAIEMDADCSHQPESIPDLVQKSQAGYDMVIGSRYMEGGSITGWPLSRKVLSFIANTLERLVLQLQLTDYTNGFRCYNTQAINTLISSPIKSTGFIMLSEITYIIHTSGLKIGEVPIHFINRTEGTSNMSFSEMWQGLVFLLSLRYPKLAKHLAQGAKYIVCGGIGALLDFGSLIILMEVLNVPSFSAFLLSTIIAVTFIFFANKYYSFNAKHTSALQEIPKFIMVYGVAIVLNSTLSELFFSWGAHYLLAKALAIGLIIVWNYTLLHTFVFKKRS